MREFMIFTLLFTLFGCQNNAGFENISIDKVTILDNEFQQVKTFTSDSELKRIQEILTDSTLEKKRIENHSNYKIDIKSTHRYSGRWLYDSNTGYLIKLNYFLKPCYMINKKDELNRLFIRK